MLKVEDLSIEFYDNTIAETVVFDFNMEVDPLDDYLDLLEKELAL